MPEHRFFCRENRYLFPFLENVLIYDMKIVFQILPKKTPNNMFLVPSLDIFECFCKILKIDKFEPVDFKHCNSFLKIPAPNAETRLFCPKV